MGDSANPVEHENQRRERSPLLPDRHPEPDFFLCDIFDAAPKSDTASMEHPLFSLATKPDMSPREYSNGERWVKIAPSPLGLATVHDRDILIYCISQCMARLNRGEKIYPTLRFSAHDLLQTTNRPTNNLGYERFKAALKRLQGTQIETNITTGGIEQCDVFSFIESFTTVKETREGRMLAMEITLSKWVFNAIREKNGEILTISRDYFRLRRPLERRLYELARKHCGRNDRWAFKIDTLRERTGSTSTPKEFNRMIREIVDANKSHNHIPDYDFDIEDHLFVIRGRGTLSIHEDQPGIRIFLRPETYEKAKELAAGWDIYQIETEWRAWTKTPPKNPDQAFLGFCKKRGPYQAQMAL